MSREIDIIKRIFEDSFMNVSLDFIEEPKIKMKRILRRDRIDDEDIVIYRLDKAGVDLFPYLKDSESEGFKGMKRKCDFVIFVSYSNTLYVLLIELKKGKDSPVQQLDVSEPLIDFVFQRASKLGCWDKKNQIQIRKIGVSDIVQKRETGNRGGILYDENHYVKVGKSNTLFINSFLH